MIYLFIYNDDFGNRETVKDILDSIPEITDWRYDLPHAFYLISDLSADQLADLVIEKKANARFFLTEVGQNRQGWLPKATWDFLNNK